ncbi:MAG TPA: hypothetical protein PLF15_01250 [bacterium]|nr:hypothetical protein [bacterium]
MYIYFKINEFLKTTGGIMTGKLVALVGPSGVGKTTIISELVDKRKLFKRILFYTTRTRRWYETHGRDYWFVSDQEIKGMLATDLSLNESLLEFGGNLFAVSHSQINSIIEAGATALLELYITRVPEFKARYNENFIALFLRPPTIDILVKRLQNCRAHEKVFVRKRMEQTQSELNLAAGELKNYFDGFIDLPNCLEAASNQVEATIRRLADI